MRSAFRIWVLTLLTVQSCVVAVGQAKASPHPSHPWKKFCQPNGGFCFKYPSSWKMLGDIYDGNGVVVAPPQEGQESLWNEVTVARVAPPSEDGGLGLDGVIDEAAKGMRAAGQEFQTLRRQESTVDAKPSQLLKAKYRDKPTGRDWIEELVFIQGPDNEIYSVALKTSPQAALRLEAVFSDVVRTWTLPEAEPPTTIDSSAAPAENSPAAAQSPRP